jgi:hypothetical protein
LLVEQPRRGVSGRTTPGHGDLDTPLRGYSISKDGAGRLERPPSPLLVE